MMGNLLIRRIVRHLHQMVLRLSGETPGPGQISTPGVEKS